eukprot:1029643-Prymnesium_polylepis.3
MATPTGLSSCCKPPCREERLHQRHSGPRQCTGRGLHQGGRETGKQRQWTSLQIRFIPFDGAPTRTLTFKRIPALRHS